MSRTVPLLTVTALAAGALVAGSTLPATAAIPLLTDPAAKVNPIIGTSGAVDDFPGADVPFGMVQWSPDTPSRPSGGGYEYNDDTVTGFSLTHISGPGCGAAGDIPVLPTSGGIGASPSNTVLPLDHAQEQAKAGRYTLTAAHITTDLTTTTRSGMGRFSYPAGREANLLFKLSGSANGTESTHFQVISPREVSGWVTSGHFCGADDVYNVYFDMVFDTPFSSSGTWTDEDKVDRGARSLATDAHTEATTTRSTTSSNGVLRTSPHIHGAGTQRKADPPTSGANGAYLTWGTSSTRRTVQAKVGLSYVSTANAKANRLAENANWDFAAVAQAAYNRWNAILAKIQIGGGTGDEQRVFETAMYHSLLHPNVFSDTNGQYLGFDDQVHRVPSGHVEYANYSGWDIYRSQVQLAAMVAPRETSDSIRSMLDQYDQTGGLPKWALNNGETYVMVGDPADPIIADAYAFGARGFDTAHALQAMLTEANQPNRVRPALSSYLSKGYIPLDGDYGCCNFYGPVSTQQEYNTADHAISTFAKALGDDDTATTFAIRANNWQNVFNPASGYLQAKYADGRFATGFTPSTSTGFVEGTSAQYTPMQPFDIAGMAAASGGNAKWRAMLDGLSANIGSPGPLNADFGNEPSVEIPWEYDYVGAPWKTQQVVRDIQQTIFTPTPDGIAGNDDLGAMSSWYVFSALGFYPETPGTADLALGSAVFPHAVVHLPTGKSITIDAPNAAASRPYVESMTVDGAAWTHAYLDPSIVRTGATLTENLSATPNKAWATGADDAPPSDTRGLASALGYTDGATAIVAPNRTSTLTIGARNLKATAQTVSWSVTATDGLSVSPSSGSLLLGPRGDATRAVSITAPATEGRYTLSIDFRDATGAALPSVATEVDVAKPGELWPYYNNAGIAADNQGGLANFDGDGWAYSHEQLVADGLGPAQSKTVAGIRFTMPDTQPGELDNIEAGGQTIPFQATSAHRLGFIGSATNAAPGAQTDVVVHFSDGTSQTVTVGLSDWTLGADSFPPAYGNTIAADAPYRDTTDGGRQVIETYLFETDAHLSGAKAITSLTIPASADDGQFHVFAIGTA